MIKMVFRYIDSNQKFKISRQKMMANINRLAKKARELGFSVTVEIGKITIDGKCFTYKQLNKGWAYIKKAQPKSLDIWM